MTSMAGQLGSLVRNSARADDCQMRRERRNPFDPQPKTRVSTNASFYPRWERHGSVSRFLLGPGLVAYRVEELDLLGGSLFVATALDTGDLVGQFESEHNACQACTR